MYTRTGTSICPTLHTDGSVVEPDMSAGFCPDHKAAMVLFLDRVYGIEDQNFLLHLLEVGFLPDLRAAASLDTVSHVSLAGKGTNIDACGRIGFGQGEILHSWSSSMSITIPISVDVRR